MNKPGMEVFVIPKTFSQAKSLGYPTFNVIDFLQPAA